MGQGRWREGKGRQLPIQGRLGRIGLEWKGIHFEHCIFEVPIIYPSGEVGSLELIEVWAVKQYIYLGAPGFYMLFIATGKKKSKTGERIQRENRKGPRTNCWGLPKFGDRGVSHRQMSTERWWHQENLMKREIHGRGTHQGIGYSAKGLKNGQAEMSPSPGPCWMVSKLGRSLSPKD